MQKTRDSSFDAFRGLAIIAVVAIHACDISLRRYPSDSVTYLSLVVYRQLLNFAVPAFIFASGYWLSKSPIESLGDYKRFLARRLSRILIPYFVWSFVHITYTAFKTQNIDIGQVIITLLTGRAPGSYYYWFIIVIAQFYVVTPVLQYLNRKWYGLTLILALNVFALLSMYVSRLNLNFWIPSSFLFSSWVIFFQLGLLAGNSRISILSSKYVRFFVLPAILVSLLLSQLEAIVILSRYNNPIAIHPLKFSSFLYSVCVILGFLFIRERFSRWPKLLVTLGYSSLGIYLIHIIVLRQAVSIFQELGAIFSFQPLYQFILVAVTLWICLILIIVARKLLPAYFCGRVLGF